MRKDFRLHPHLRTGPSTVDCHSNIMPDSKRSERVNIMLRLFLFLLCIFSLCPASELWTGRGLKLEAWL